ncbi:MAG TPA: molybdate ABC transporter substrate-binding protein [Candidatus Angelobacter sp.]|nr:molybdate ABC transporter substrate-binding protein [Candidatus Angelobacter sp.]
MYVPRLLLILSLLTVAAPAQTLKVAAASDLSAAMDKLVPLFEKQTGVHVSLALGSSGNFFAQMQNGAPFDVFLSADKSYPEKLQQAGLAEPNTLTAYGRGRLVVWTRNNSTLRFASKDGKVLSGGLEALTGAQVGKIAVANPAHAPYGRAAIAALEHYRIYDKVKAKLVLGENISQTAQFAQSGNADVGFIALSLALTTAMSGSGHWLMLPEESYPPIEQAAVILRSSGNKDQAKKFLSFLTSPQGQAILHDSGFEATPK